jgi:Nucleoside transporter
MSLVHYWKDTYGTTGYIELVFFSNIGGFTAFLIYKRVFTNINTQTVLLIVPWISLGLNALLVFVGKWIPDQRSPIKIIVNGVANLIVGMMLFVIRYTYSSLVFKRGSIQVAFYNAGMPISGICNTVIGMIMYSTLHHVDRFEKALSYMGFQALTLAVVHFVNLAYFAKARGTDLLKISKKEIARPASTGNAQVFASPSLWATMKLSYTMMYNTFFLWSVTMMILPNMFWALGLGWQNKNIEPLVCVLAYVVCDFAGRLAYSKFVLKSTMACHYIGLFRVIFIAVPLYAYSGLPGSEEMLDNQYMTLPYIVVHALITGYVSSSQMHITGRRVAPRHKDNAAYLITLSTLCGLLFGSMCNLLALRLNN